MLYFHVLWTSIYKKNNDDLYRKNLPARHNVNYVV